MADYVCVIQAGQEASQKRDALGEGLRRIGQEAFGDDPAAIEISWIDVKRGFAWTAGEIMPEPGEEAAWLERHR